MNILLDGYFDCNFGDDMMMRLVAKQLPDYNFYVRIGTDVFRPFESIPNVNRDDGSVSFDACLCVTGSGFIVQSNIALMYAVKEYLCRKKSTVPKATIGCNIERFRGPLSKFLMYEKIRSNGLLTCRDFYSEKVLTKCAGRSLVYCFPDILFGMDDAMLPNKTGEDCVGISASFPRKDGLDEYCGIMARVADFANDKNRHVILFSFDNGIENDSRINMKIKSMCKNPDNVEILTHNSNGDNILKGYSRCSVVVGTRFHSIVTALRTSTTIVPVAYNLKTRNMLSDIGYDGRVYDIDALDVNAIIDDINSGKPAFILPSEIVENARLHTEKFREWLEGIYNGKNIGCNSGI